jgi:hypothetical protein
VFDLHRRIISDCMPSQNWGTDGCVEWDLEGSGFGLTEICCYPDSQGGTEGKYENLRLDCLCLAKIKNCTSGVIMTVESGSVLRKTCRSVSTCLPQISYGLTQNRTPASTLRCQQVFASTLAWTFRGLRLTGFKVVIL